MIVNYLEELLEERNKNLNWLAREVGMSYSSIHRFANNPILPVSTKTVDLVVIALDCQIQDLLKVIRPQDYLEQTQGQVEMKEDNLQLMAKIFGQHGLDIQCQDKEHYGSRELHRFMGRLKDPETEFGFGLRLQFDYMETAWMLTTEEFGVSPQTEENHIVTLLSQYLQAMKVYCEDRGIRKIVMNRLPEAQGFQKALEGIMTQAGYDVRKDKKTRQTYWESFALIEWKKGLEKISGNEG